MLHTDNGKEFDNKQLRDYLEEKGIEYRKGRPYNPRSQGSVEAFNRTIHNFLIRAKDMKGNNFNLEESVNEFILHYNQRKHSTHGYKPSYIMQIFFNKELLKKIFDNSEKTRNNVKQKVVTFAEG